MAVKPKIESLGNPESWLDHCQVYLNTINHMIIACISAYTTWLCYERVVRNGFQSVTWHVWLCTIGFQLLICQAIMSMYQQNSWTSLHTKRTKTNLHWILQALGSTMAIAGMIQYFVSREVHFVSTHSQIGLAAGICLCLSVLNGISALWSRELFRRVKPVYKKLIHNIIGTVAFVLGMSALVYGFNQGPFRTMTTENVVVAMQILCGFTIIFTLFGAAKSLVRLVQGAFPRMFYRGDEDDAA